MYSSRRPWSPESFNHSFRVPSDVSVEALDLADYAATLRQPRTPSNLSSPYPPFFQSVHLTSATPLNASSNNDVLNSVPSLTLSDSRSFSYSSHDPPTPYPYQSPSLASSHFLWEKDLLSRIQVKGDTERKLTDSDTEIDITQFPSWSHPWYKSEKKVSSPLAFETDTRKNPYNINEASLSQAYISPSSQHRQHSELLPWSGDDDNIPSEISPQTKEDRLQLLNREFGSISIPAKDIHGEHAIGSIDDKGNLITAGPKKRIALRCIECFLTLGATVASLYSALILKPPKPPPPEGKFPAYSLYILSVLTDLLLLYLFLIRPCCCSAQRKHVDTFQGPPGMMVLPIQGFNGDPSGKRGKRRGKSGKDRNGNGSVQVNLIVDPSMFGNKDKTREDDQEGAEINNEAHSVGKRNRRGIFEGLALEKQWRYARSSLKLMLICDILVVILWTGVFVIILMGQRCPSGQFLGWCDGYNLATSFACFLAIAFGLSVFFDIKDLFASKLSPRTRT